MNALWSMNTLNEQRQTIEHRSCYMPPDTNPLEVAMRLKKDPRTIVLSVPLKDFEKDFANDVGVLYCYEDHCTTRHPGQHTKPLGEK